MLELVALSLLLSGSFSLSPSDFLIESLPNYNGSATFKQYAGWMPLPDEDETSLFFWFVESQSDPTSDPVAGMLMTCIHVLRIRGFLFYFFFRFFFAQFRYFFVTRPYTHIYKSNINHGIQFGCNKS